jgi:dipeptidyl aminopeptidase/acylaminoacyl peptidase
MEKHVKCGAGIFAGLMAAVLCLAFYRPSLAQPQDPAETAEEATAETRWTVDDFVAPEFAGDFHVSPDGQWAVWVKTVPDAEKDEQASHLYLSSLKEKREIQLTRGPSKDESPRWSPDGRLVAFLSDRALPKKPAKEEDADDESSKTQLWLINPFGGEPWPLTRSERAVKDFDWIDADTILIAAEEDPSLYERKLKERKDDSRAVDDAAHTPPVRLFKIDVKTQDVTRFTHNDDWIQLVEVSPDGKKAVAVHQRSLSYEFDQRVKPVTFLYDLASGKSQQLFTDGKVLPTRIRWKLDSTGFYAVSPYSTHPTYRVAVVDQLYYYDLPGQRTVKVDLGWENELGIEARNEIAITPNGFLALLAAGARFRLARYTGDGATWKRTWMEGENASNVFDIEASKDGKTIVYDLGTASRPGQYFRAALGESTLGAPVALTEQNASYQKKPAAKSEVARWKGSRDEDVEGILYYPQDYVAGKKYALVVMIHGGPVAADMDTWDEDYAYPINLYTQRGAFVLQPNYHGSGNYGLAWAESIGGGKYYDLEVPDIEKGVEALIARGFVDPERMGILGWSNGAILTWATALKDPRFKVASAGAGDVEYISDWANVDFGAAFDNYYFGAAPYEDPQLYIRKSPLFRLRDLRVPTLIFFGTEDRNVPPDQGWEEFRTLQQLGQTPVRFILFPGEPHGPRKLSHRRRKLEEEQAWFDKYLFKPGATTNEAFRADSPLGELIKRQHIKKVGLDYGEEVKSTLVPETAAYKGLTIGRFEVTRAQYAAFDRNYKIEPGTENYPANGITFEQAQAYCAWLSKLAGETYRLGSQAEMAPLYKTSAASENTLDYWAGYKTNPDDAARLTAKTKDLANPAPLLKEVGSFRGVGEEELVFDLGGNVAEWCVTKDGKGKALGGSADRSTDPKAADSQPGAAYVGFRVVKGAPPRLVPERGE